MASPISTIGSYFSYATTESGTYTEIDIKTFSDPFGSPESIDVTHMRNTRYTSIPGLQGSTSANDMTANYDPKIFAEIQALGDTEVYQRLTFSDGTGAKWKGRLAVSLSDGSVNSALEMTLHCFASSDVEFIEAA